jgi:DNA end-binding protein Ku
MKAIWKGAISFGLVTIPVRVYTASEEKTVRFHQVHAKDGGRIKMKRTCSVCGEEVAYDEIAKGYEFEKDRMVVMTEEEVERGTPSTRSIDILSFVRVEDIDPIYWQKSYYLEPEPTCSKAYALLRKALGEDGLVALARFTIRDKDHLATLRLRGKTFVLETMYWPDEIREPDFDILDADVELRPQEQTMAASLVESLGADFDPSQFHDEYRDAVEEMIERKRTTGETRPAPVATAPADEGDSMTDLLSALQASVDAARSKAGGAEKPAEEKKAPAKRSSSAKSRKKDDDADEKPTRKRKPA